MSRTGGATPVISLRGITKHFGGVYAIKGIDLDIYPGEVLALVGDNGAGKSTLIKIISGAYAADEGEILIDGVRAQIGSPADAKRHHIETIYQDLALMDNLDIPPNIFMGREIVQRGILGAFGILDFREMVARTRALLTRLNIELPDLKRKVFFLSGGQRQAVAISRALYFDARVIIMDEPTAALGVEETAKVYSLICELRQNGIAVIVISHNINEVFGIADRFVVLKTGEVVGVKAKESTNLDEILRMIIAGRAYACAQPGS